MNFPLRVFAIVGLAVVIIGGTFWFFLSSKLQPSVSQNQQQVQQKELVWEERLLTDSDEEASLVGWSPDDSEILYLSDKGNNEWAYGTMAFSESRKNSSLWIVKPDGSGKRRLTADVNGNVQYAIWSPDGTKIAYVSDEGEQVVESGYFKEVNVWMINSDGSNKKKVTGTKLQKARKSTMWNIPADQTKIYWNLDGKRIIVWLYASYVSLGGRIPAPDQLWITNSDGTGEEKGLTNEDAGQDSAWSANIQQINLSKYGGYEGNAVKIDFGRNTFQWIQNDTSEKSGFESPDGKKIASFADSLSTAICPTTYFDQWELVNLSKDVKKAISVKENTNKKTQELFFDLGVCDGTIEWSPDSTKILYINDSLRYEGELYILDVINSKEVKIESPEFPELFQSVTPLWFSDNAHILFAIKEYGYPRTYRDGLWLVNMDGTNLQKINNRDVSLMSWSHDGKKMLVDSSVLVNSYGNQYSKSSVSILEFKSE